MPELERKTKGVFYEELSYEQNVLFMDLMCKTKAFRLGGDIYFNTRFGLFKHRRIYTGIYDIQRISYKEAFQFSGYIERNGEGVRIKYGNDSAFHLIRATYILKTVETRRYSDDYEICFFEISGKNSEEKIIEVLKSELMELNRYAR